MKVYFTAQLYDKHKYIDNYVAIRAELQRLGHEVITDIFESSAEKVLQQSEEEMSRYYRTWCGFLKKADVCIADISFPSTVNIGFEVASILNRGKPVIALYREGTDPVFIAPDFSQRMIKVAYTHENLRETLEWAIEEAKQLLDRRFTFFVSPEIDDHLNKIIKDGSISRSEYIRNLILKEMKNK